MVDLLKWPKLNLEANGFRRIPKVTIGGDGLDLITAHGGSGDELR